MTITPAASADPKLEEAIDRTDRESGNEAATKNDLRAMRDDLRTALATYERRRTNGNFFLIGCLALLLIAGNAGSIWQVLIGG